MAKNNNLTDFLTDLANTIRTKKGYASTVKLNPQNFSSEISSISTSTPGAWSDYITINSNKGVPLVKTSGTFSTSDKLDSINVNAANMNTINLTNGGIIATINADGQNTKIQNIHLTNRGYVGNIYVNTESYINNINNTGTVYITNSPQAGSVTITDQAQLILSDSEISTLSGFGQFMKLDNNGDHISINHMQANSSLGIDVTSTSSTSSSTSGGTLLVQDHTGTYTIANKGVITKATMGTGANGTNKSTINAYPINTERHVNCSAGYHTTEEYYTIRPYAFTVAIPANTTTISISCSSGTSYLVYGTSAIAAVTKSFTTTETTDIPAGTTEHSRCMHLNNNSTSNKRYTIKCLNSSGTLLATRNFTVNYRHSILVFSDIKTSIARTMYIQILLD